MTYHGRRIREKIDGFKMYKPIQADPSVRNKNDRDGVSYRDYFYQVSKIFLDEANNSLADGIDRVRDFMYMGKLKIFTNCVNMKEEAGNYVWKKDKDGIMKDTPVDRYNHLMDALRYLVMALPMNLKDCYANTRLDNTKETLLDRLRPDTDVSDLLDDGFSFANVYGFNNFNMN